MKNNFIVVYDRYSGLTKKALEMINATVSDYYRDFLPFVSADKLSVEELNNNSLILVGQKDSNDYIAKAIDCGAVAPAEKPQGYSIAVTDSVWNSEKQMIVICGYDESGVLYGAVDFINKYCGSILYKTPFGGDMMNSNYFERAFQVRLKEWKSVEAPSVANRGIWSWGHVIYDYRRFFDNMIRLKLNEAVIWNNYIPVNAADVVEYAHSLGIKVIWGYAWGWDTDCTTATGLDEKSLNELRDKVIAKYETEYAHIGGDGIYFQSFTELNVDHIGDKLIAETVVNFVNDVAARLLAKYPTLKIQFGLHANSVKKHLDFIKRVDPRIMIVWENCGGFPFYGDFGDYGDERDAGNQYETLAFMREISVLRGKNDSFGMIFKGMLALDWGHFVHPPKNIILGERSDLFIRKRAEEKNKIWKLRQTNWIRYAERVREIVECCADKHDLNVQGLVEDGLLENAITLPVAIYAETLWDCNRSGEETVLDVMKYPCVKMANV